MSTDKKMIDLGLWFFAACVFLILVTSCSPYVDLPPTSTPAAKPTAAAVTTAISPSQAKPKISPALQICTVRTGLEAGRLNLRTGAGVTFEVIRVLPEGETLKVLERGAWLKVIDDQGARGYVNSRYCQVKP